MIDDPSSEEAKELYAHFGLAFYCSSVLEHGVANAIFILELMDKGREVKTRQEWETLVDNQFEYENRVSHSVLKDTRTIKG